MIEVKKEQGGPAASHTLDPRAWVQEKKRTSRSTSGDQSDASEPTQVPHLVGPFELVEQRLVLSEIW